MTSEVIDCGPFFLPRHAVNKFPSKHCFGNVPHILLCCVFIFILLKIPYIALKIFFSLNHGLFRNVLFGFQTFWDFSNTFLLLIYDLILLWPENTLYITLR